MEILSGIASKLGELLVDATVKQARYLFCFNSIVKELEDKETNLKEVQDGINEKVEEERQKHCAIVVEKDVEKWLADVVKEMADVRTLKAKLDEKKSCFNGWCPNWGCQYWMGRKASKETRKLSDLLQDRSKFSTVARPKPLPSDKELPIPRHFMPFATTESACYQIIKALKGDNTKIVGLYGIGGVGKTTLANFVGNQLREENVFDEVGIATVSQDQNIINVQSELVKSLGWELTETYEKDRARRLRMMFSESKSRKMLIILDDVWNELDLEKVGIPVGDRDNCCKILLTTRLQPVCDRMGCDTQIQLGVLKQDEGLDLLRKHAGIDVADTTLIDVSKQVADECKGLPLAIKAVGSALRGRTADEWNVALDKLQNAKLDKIEGIDKDSQGVYGCLKFSFDYLNGEDSRSCFLLCSLFPEDYKIDLEDLLGYAVGLVWYQAESIEKARSLLRGTIKGLKDSSLLLDIDDDRFVKMHDVVRDVALWIGKVEKKYFTSKVGIGLEELAVEEDLEQCRGISLVGNEKEELPSGLVCPNLHILRLENTEYDNKLQVPEHFFKEMPTLKVVTVIGGVLSLKSLQILANNLRVLQLIRCEVTDASFLGKLKRLQILYLEKSPIEIPDGLGDELSRLKLLYIDTGSISPITINKFPQIEEFYGVIKDWEVEGMSSEESYGRCAESDSQPDGSVVCLPKDFSFPKLQRYRISEVDKFSIANDLGTRCLIIENNHPKATLGIFSALYQNLEILYLSGVTGCHNIVPSIDERGLNELTILHVTDCKDLECIMDASKSPHGKSGNPVMLSRLAELSMWELPELKWIWKAPAQHVISLQSLTELTVSDCNNLTYIFTLSQARSLVQLKSLEVSDCERLECIVEAKFDHNEREISVGDGNTILALPSLRKLRFKDLPELISFCSENYYSTWPALEELDLASCPKLTVNSTEIEANLQYLGEKLRILKVGKCFHLRDTIDALLKHGFENLETLDIGELGVQVVFQVEAIIAEGQENKLFPCLKSLQLKHLPELRVLLYHEGPTHNFSLQNLTHLRVDGCTMLRRLFSSTLARNLSQLKLLGIVNCLELEQIIDEDEDEDHLQPVCFPKLTMITVSYCPKLKRLFHISVAPSLQKLESLFITANDELEEVFWHKDGANVTDYNEIVMNKLQVLEVTDLPNLTNFWPAGYQISIPSYKVFVHNCPMLPENSGDILFQEFWRTLVN
ncbi:Disease resistance protein [Citrus sinensis]|nr:probable disease resistance protein At4g27220 isoform X2 [Citrus sinensis]XP_052287790.1 probable disease resistance protein At4g27220 isoform X2 [Citrus sinensis]XP_052287791.1 probable disease resistance protein At4g27220 isoform X2 [Citrus sinensis]XP_052287792.1 probable disease resistance protein At4g27220 isoform X2 [Citrus sinensis]XP_052287793.1 probable disease resistance protein At4g27220 isoform X2 [Citrus sinensis]XP_052287794.1 probable disease resistance protein At4g27220 isof